MELRGHSWKVTRFGHAVLVYTLFLLFLTLPVFPAEAASCVGDCDGTGQVTVEEIVKMVRVALGVEEASLCSPGDPNADGAITVDEIVAAVGRAVEGCTTSCALCTVVGQQCADAVVSGAKGFCALTLDGDFVCHTDNRIFCLQYSDAYCNSDAECGAGERCLQTNCACCKGDKAGACSFFIHQCD